MQKTFFLKYVEHFSRSISHIIIPISDPWSSWSDDLSCQTKGVTFRYPYDSRCQSLWQSLFVDTNIIPPNISVKWISSPHDSCNGSCRVVFAHFILFLFVYSEIIFKFEAEIKWIAIMDIKKITHEEALRRWKHSLEIKREWERKVAERWANEDQQKIALVW